MSVALSFCAAVVCCMLVLIPTADTIAIVVAAIGRINSQIRIILDYVVREVLLLQLLNTLDIISLIESNFIS